MRIDPEVIKAYREQATLTQRELAQCSGVTLSTINRLEQGMQEPHISTVRKIAKALEWRPGVDPG